VGVASMGLGKVSGEGGGVGGGGLTVLPLGRRGPWVGEDGVHGVRRGFARGQGERGGGGRRKGVEMYFGRE